VGVGIPVGTGVAITALLPQALRNCDVIKTNKMKKIALMFT
jgi:hypothetical protein